MTDTNLDHYALSSSPYNKLIDANDADADDDAAATDDGDDDGDKPRANYAQRAGMSVLGTLASQNSAEGPFSTRVSAPSTCTLSSRYSGLINKNSPAKCRRFIIFC